MPTLRSWHRRRSASSRGSILQRLIIRDVTPDGYAVGVASLLDGQRENG